MKRHILALAMAMTVGAASAQVVVHEPWVRATVANQQASGAFMQLNASRNMKLVEARSPVAAQVEIHQMTMDHDVMKMRPVKFVPLPAGKPVALEPGSYHIMLLGLKKQIRPGDVVPLTIVIEGEDGQRQSIEVKAPARELSAMTHNH